MLHRDHTKERWSDLQDYYGVYQISTFGKIKSIDRSVIQSGPKNGNYSRIMKGIDIKQSLQNGGYCVVWLSKNGTVKPFTVHRLVAIMFIENPNGLEQVNHKDGDKTNNHINNLEWCSRSENVKHAYANIPRKKWGAKRNAI